MKDENGNDFDLKNLVTGCVCAIRGIIDNMKIKVE